MLGIAHGDLPKAEAGKLKIILALKPTLYVGKTALYFIYTERIPLEIQEVTAQCVKYTRNRGADNVITAFAVVGMPLNVKTKAIFRP